MSGITIDNTPEKLLAFRACTAELHERIESEYILLKDSLSDIATEKSIDNLTGEILSELEALLQVVAAYRATVDDGVTQRLDIMERYSGLIK